MLKVLYVCRLFSGLEESINNRRWRPTGVPTIYRVIDKLKKNKKLHGQAFNFGPSIKKNINLKEVLNISKKLWPKIGFLKTCILIAV